MSGPAPILGSMRADGSRLKVHPADVRGRWLTARRVVFVVLMAVYVLAPFIPIGGHPAMFTTGLSLMMSPTRWGGPGGELETICCVMLNQ